MSGNNWEPRPATTRTRTEGANVTAELQHILAGNLKRPVLRARSLIERLFGRRQQEQERILVDREGVAYLPTQPVQMKAVGKGR